MVCPRLFDEEIAKIVEEAREKQQSVYEKKFKAQLEAMTQQLNEIVASYSPGRAVTVSPAEVELKAPRTTFDVAVLDGTTETAVERQGHGFQRTLLISALQLLAQSGALTARALDTQHATSVRHRVKRVDRLLGNPHLQREHIEAFASLICFKKAKGDR